MIHIPFERRGFIPTLREQPTREDQVITALGAHPQWEERDLGRHLEGVTKFVDVDVDGSTIIIERTTGICRDRETRHIIAWFGHTLWERMIIHEIRHRLCRGDYSWSGPPPEKYVCGDLQRVAHLKVSSEGWTHDVWLWQDTGLATHAATGIYLGWLHPRRIAVEIQHANGLPQGGARLLSLPDRPSGDRTPPLVCVLHRPVSGLNLPGFRPLFASVTP